MNKQRRVLRAVLSGPCSVCECREWSGLQRIPCMPRERGDKIISRDPKWAVLWRCWKKPFSGAAANSVQVQIIYLDPRWKERKTFMSNQVGTRRRGPLFIGRIGPLFAEAHTRCTVSHFESLLFASWYSPVSEFKMAALCTSVILCGSAAPFSVEDFSGCVWSRWPVGRRSSAEMQTLFVAPLAGRGAELMHKMRPHSGDSVVRCCVPAHRQRLAARLLLSTRYLSLQHVPPGVSVGQHLFVVVSRPAVPRTSCRHCLREHLDSHSLTNRHNTNSLYKQSAHVNGSWITTV